MKYLIKINLKTIKKNKDFGNYQSIIPTNKTIKFEFEGTSNLPDYFKPDNNCIIVESIKKFEIKVSYLIKGYIISEDLLKKCIDEKLNINLELNQNYITVDHFPIPEYSYKYINTLLVCNNCNNKIKSDDLKSDEFYDYYSDKVCPKCGAFDCCDITYESIENALIRKSNKNTYKSFNL